MTRPLVTYPDPESLMVDHLEALLDGTVAAGIPTDWTPTDGDHLQVQLDGTPIDLHPIGQRATVRLIARGGAPDGQTRSSPTRAKDFVQLAHAHALVGPWPEGITNVRPLTGPLPARDPDTLAELAAVTVQVTVRSTPIDGS